MQRPHAPARGRDRRHHIWQGEIVGGPLTGRHLRLVERDGSDVLVATHFQPGRPDSQTTTLVRGETGLDELLGGAGRVRWRRLWRSDRAA